MIVKSNGAISAVEKAKRTGIVRHIGASTHSMDIAIECAVLDGY